MDKNLTAIELTEAELKWLKSIQQVAFGAEYKELLSGKNVVHNCQLILFLDNGIIRCRGRVNKADLPTSAKNPVLLPEKHYFSRLLVKEKHELVHHNGIQETLIATRQTYWILKGRKLVKNVIWHCVVCNRYKGKSYSVPLIPDLTTERVSSKSPFSNTGVDFSRPLYVKGESINRSHTQGVHMSLYMCLH